MADSRKPRPVAGGGVAAPAGRQTKLGSSSSSASLSLAPAVTSMRIKLLSIGSGGCGKSCLIKRYCEDRFVQKYIATIGIDYGVKPVQVDGSEV